MSAEILDECASEYRAGRNQAKRSREEWIQGTLQMARALYTARQQFPSNRDFSIWLLDNEMDDYEKDDRAALIKMGQHLEATAQILPSLKSISYQLNWIEIERHVLNVKKTDLVQAEAPEPPKEELLATNSDIPVVAETTNSVQPIEEIAVNGRELPKSSPLWKYERAKEVWALYEKPETRTILTKAVSHKRAFGEIWKLILAAADNGFLKTNRTTSSKRDGLALRLIFPEAPPRGEYAGMDLLQGKVRDHVKEVIMPAAIACREEILAEPHRVEDICAQYLQTQKVQARERAERKKIEEAIKRLPQDQQEIVAYGETMWPCSPYQSPYDYDQIRAAAWTFKCVEGMLRIGNQQSSAESIGIMIRHLVKFLLEYAMHREPSLKKMVIVIQLVKNISIAYQKDPSASCKWPNFPIGGIEGKWD